MRRARESVASRLQIETLRPVTLEHRSDSAPSFAVIDLETTGLEPQTGRLIECAVIGVSRTGTITDEWNSLIAIPGWRTLGAEQIHGITRKMLAGAPTFLDLVGELIAHLENRVLIGHVLDFDIAYLQAEFARLELALPDLKSAGLCTRDLARRYLPEGRRSLAACCAVAGVAFPGAHRALGDARATAGLLRHFLSLECEELNAAPFSQALDLVWPEINEAPKSPASRHWPIRKRPRAVT